MKDDLYRAIEAGLEELKKCGLNPDNINEKDEESKFTPLAYACMWSKDVTCIEYLLDLGADPNCVCGWQEDTTPLHKAAQESSAEVLKLLIDRGGDVNSHVGASPLGDGDIAVFRAVNGGLDNFKVFAQAGANLKVKWFGSTLSAYAKKQNQLEIVEFLKTNK